MDKGDHSSMLGLSIALPVIASICVGARFWARHENKAGLKWDDWLTLLALVFTIGMGVTLIIGTALHATTYPRSLESGPDRLTENSPQKIIEQKVEFSVTLMFTIQVGLVKCSLLAFFHRIFCVNTSFYRHMVRGLIVLCAVWSISFFLAFMFDCGLPVSNHWGPLIIYQTKCHGLNWEQGFAVSDFILDLAILIIPLPPIWRLQMSLKRKIGVTIIMMVATMAIVASLIRVVIVFTVVGQVKSAFMTADGNILDSEVLWWMLLEAGMSVIAASLPAVHSLPLRKYSSRLQTQTGNSLRSLIGRGTPDRRRTIDLEHQDSSSSIKVEESAELEKGIR